MDLQKIEKRKRAKGIHFKEKSKTHQSFKKECDANWIVNQFTRTGDKDLLNKKQMPRYGDYSDQISYQEAMHITINANNAFAALPAEVRSIFDNDPHKMLGFLDNPENNDEAIKLGLKAAPKTAPDPLDVAADKKLADTKALASKKEPEAPKTVPEGGEQ